MALPLARFLKAKSFHGRILERIDMAKNHMTTSKEISKTLKEPVKKVSNALNLLERDGVTYKLYPDFGNCYWGLMKHFRCERCGSLANPSRKEVMRCVGCEDSEYNFQMGWATKQLTPEPPDCPVWVYGG